MVFWGSYIVNGDTEFREPNCSEYGVESVARVEIAQSLTHFLCGQCLV